MGMTLKRVTFGALALAAILLPLRKSRTTSAIAPSQDRSLRLETLRHEDYLARMHWIALEQRDSALAHLATVIPTGTLPGIIREGFPANAPVPSVERAVTSSWNKIGVADSSVAVTVLVYNATGYRGVEEGRALLTETAGRQQCVAMIPGQFRTRSGDIVDAYGVQPALAPCVLMATFGSPGVGVKQWLTSTRFVAAQSNDWLLRRGLSEYTSAPWPSWWMQVRGVPWSSPVLFVAKALGVLELGQMMAPPYRFGVTGLRCLDGDEAACVQSVMHSAVMTESDQGYPRDLTLDPDRAQPVNTTITTVRPPAAQFVSGIINDFGREKFGKFWKSDLPFEQAFQQAFDVSLGAWTARWARREWLRTFESVHEGGGMNLGVTLNRIWPIVVIGWTAIALMAASAVARRRQVA